MKGRIFFGGISVAFLAELLVLLLFVFSERETCQDTVEVNEVVQTVQKEWDSVEKHANGTALDYVVLDTEGMLLYRTKPGLSQTINAAVGHRDIILDVIVEGNIVGKVIVYNDSAAFFQRERQAVFCVIIVVMLLQCGLCAGCFLYVQCAVIKPFFRLKKFAERIAEGNLDISLEMDRRNVFGAFTESFDIMRSELKKARAAQARADESKKELVAKLSHDIKTPVASIKAASEVGATLAQDEKNRHNYESIVQKADQINTLVTDLFSAALEELQELTVTPAEMRSCELGPLLENADYLHRAAIPPVPGCVLSADRLRLQQVFDNIFANSYKYADTRINVAISVKGNYLTVSVEDGGGGVPEPELLFLKEKFKRGSNTENIEGAGLGLYISDYCMRKMQGRLQIENGSSGLKVTVWVILASEI